METSTKQSASARLRKWIQVCLSERLFPLRMLLVLGVAGAVFYILNCLMPYFADDAWYMHSFATGERITSIQQIFPSLYTHYHTMNGRLVTHFLAHLFLMIDKSVFNVVNTLCFLALGVTIFYHCGFFKGDNRRAIQLGLIFIFLYYVIPDFREDFLWVTGAANYLYGIFLILLFLIPYRRTLENPMEEKVSGSIRQWLFAVVNFPLGILAGATNENTGAALVCMVALIIGLRLFLYRKKVYAWMVTGWIGSLMGCIFMLAAPANRVRIDGVASLSAQYRDSLVPGMSMDLFQMLRPVVSALISIFSYHMVPFLLFTLVLMLFFRQYEPEQWRDKLMELVPSGVFFLGAALSAGAFIVSPSSPERVWSGSIILSVIAIGCVLPHIKLENPVEKLSLQVIIPWILVICSLASCANTVWEMNKQNVEEASYEETVQDAEVFYPGISERLSQEHEIL